MRQLLSAAFCYVAAVFAAAFALGVVRVLILTPALGALGAVLLELPIVLALSWWVAGRVLRRWPDVVRWQIGALAFAMLIAAEVGLAVTLMGQTPAAFGAGLMTLPGAIGLAGQIVFGLIPALRR
jgi:hypothetical protein